MAGGRGNADGAIGAKPSVKAPNLRDVQSVTSNLQGVSFGGV